MRPIDMGHIPEIQSWTGPVFVSLTSKFSPNFNRKIYDFYLYTKDFFLGKMAQICSTFE